MFPSATDECIRCYRLRDLLSLVGDYVFVGAIIIYPMILPPCFSGGDFSLRLTLSRSQPRAKMARSAGENKKDPYFYIQVTERNTKKRTALVRLKR